MVCFCAPWMPRRQANDYVDRPRALTHIGYLALAQEMKNQSRWQVVFYLLSAARHSDPAFVVFSGKLLFSATKVFWNLRPCFWTLASSGKMNLRSADASFTKMLPPTALRRPYMQLKQKQEKEMKPMPELSE